jgi:hypothetical protein
MHPEDFPEAPKYKAMLITQRLCFVLVSCVLRISLFLQRLTQDANGKEMFQGKGKCKAVPVLN